MKIDLISFLIGFAIAALGAYLILRSKKTGWQTLSGDSLRQNNELFLQLAESRFRELESSSKATLEQKEQSIAAIVVPVQQSLEKMDQAMQSIEKNRIGAYSELKQQVAGLMDTQHMLRAETGNLVRALRTPDVRGRWGEIQLRRVAEMAGMIEHCDFAQQETMVTADGKSLRPDMTIKLPGNKCVVVDAKTPIDAWLDATNDQLSAEARDEALIRHSRHVKKHLQDLGTKKYFENLDGSPEFVIMFLPDEGAFTGALKKDPTLIEFGAAHHVIIATPITLITLLRTIHYGWRQDVLANEARDISKIGNEILERLSGYGKHLDSMGNHLGKAVEAYNKGVQHLDSRIWPSLRKMQGKGVISKTELQDTKAIELTPARSNAPEFILQDSETIAKPIRFASNNM